jgi:hypothetical protein
MKIMVPYEEPTDTCPDCSDIPCDCGLPAGYQSNIRFAANFAPHIKVMEASKVAEIIQQRDDLLRYNQVFRQDALICANCDAISKEEYDRAIEQRDGLRSAVDYASDQLIRITEQLDRLVEALEKAKAVYTPSSGGEYQTGWHDAICWVNQQAIQSLNPDHTVAANDMIAAVKGRSDES